MFGNFGGDESLQEPNSALSLNGDWFSSADNAGFTTETPFFDDFDFHGGGSVMSSRNNSAGVGFNEYRVPDMNGGVAMESVIENEVDGSARKRKNSEEKTENDDKLEKKRKKTVYEILHRQLSDLVSAKLLVEVGTYATLLSAPQAEDVLIRKAIVKTFLNYRVRNVAQSSKWRDLLDDSFVLDLPDTSIYRTSAVRNMGGNIYGGNGGGFSSQIGASSGGKRRIVGINGMIQDVASITAFLEMINYLALQKHKSIEEDMSLLKPFTPTTEPATSSQVKGKNDVNMSNKSQTSSTSSPPPIRMCCHVKASDIVVDGPRLMSHWVLSTCGLAEYKGFNGKECGIDGMLKCNFNDKHKLVSMELTFDVLSFARQLSNLGLKGSNKSTPNEGSTRIHNSLSTTPTYMNNTQIKPQVNNAQANTQNQVTGIGLGNSRGSLSHRDAIAPLPPLRVTIPHNLRQSISSPSYSSIDNRGYPNNGYAYNQEYNNAYMYGHSHDHHNSVNDPHPPSLEFLQYSLPPSLINPMSHNAPIMKGGYPQPSHSKPSHNQSTNSAMHSMGLSMPTQPSFSPASTSGNSTPNFVPTSATSMGSHFSIQKSGSGPQIATDPNSPLSASWPPGTFNNMLPPPLSLSTSSTSSTSTPTFGAANSSNFSLPPALNKDMFPPYRNTGQTSSTTIDGVSSLQTSQLDLPLHIQKMMAKNNGLLPIGVLNSLVSSMGLNNLGLSSLLNSHNPHAPFPGVPQLGNNNNFSINQSGPTLQPPFYPTTPASTPTAQSQVRQPQVHSQVSMKTEAKK